MVDPSCFSNSSSTDCHRTMNKLIVSAITSLLASPSASRKSVFDRDTTFHTFSPALPRTMVACSTGNGPITAPTLGLLVGSGSNGLLGSSGLITRLGGRHGQVVATFCSDNLGNNAGAPGVNESRTYSSYNAALFIKSGGETDRRTCCTCLTLLSCISDSYIPRKDSRCSRFTHPTSRPTTLFGNFINAVEVVHARRCRAGGLREVSTGGGPVKGPMRMGVFAPSGFNCSVIMGNVIICTGHVSRTRFCSGFLLSGCVSYGLNFEYRFSSNNFRRGLVSSPGASSFRGVRITRGSSSGIFISAPRRRFMCDSNPCIPVNFAISGIFRTSSALSVKVSTSRFRSGAVNLPRVIVLKTVNHAECSNRVVESCPISRSHFGGNFSLRAICVGSDGALNSSCGFIFTNGVTGTCTSRARTRTTIGNNDASGKGRSVHG